MQSSMKNTAGFLSYRPSILLLKAPGSFMMGFITLHGVTLQFDGWNVTVLKVERHPISLCRSSVCCRFEDTSKQALAAVLDFLIYFWLYSKINLLLRQSDYCVASQCSSTLVLLVPPFCGHRSCLKWAHFWFYHIPLNQPPFGTNQGQTVLPDLRDSPESSALMSYC